MHLLWQLPLSTGPIVEVSVVCEIVEPPLVPDLYFWALQAGFADDRHHLGAGHLGLQWYRAHPRGRAVNWGGYGAAGGELAGSESAMPSATGNPNTRDYLWQTHRPYRLGISRGEHGWRGTVTDLATGTATVVRELGAGGDRLVEPMVWSEVFAACDAPMTAVRWSELEVVTDDRERIRSSAVRVNYQSHADGGCANTDVEVDGGGAVQITNTERRTPLGSLLSLGS